MRRFQRRAVRQRMACGVMFLHAIAAPASVAAQDAEGVASPAPVVRLHPGGAAQVDLAGGLTVTLPALLVSELDAVLLHDDTGTLRRGLRGVLDRHAGDDPVLARAVVDYAAAHLPERALAIRQSIPRGAPGRTPVAVDLNGDGAAGSLATQEPPTPLAPDRNTVRDSADRSLADQPTARRMATTSERPPRRVQDRDPLLSARTELRTLTPERPEELDGEPLLSSALTTTVVGPSPVASPSNLFFP